MKAEPSLRNKAGGSRFSKEIGNLNGPTGQKFQRLVNGHLTNNVGYGKEGPQPIPATVSHILKDRGYDSLDEAIRAGDHYDTAPAEVSRQDFHEYSKWKKSSK